MSFTDILSKHWEYSSGVYSVCSANHFVIEAAMLQAQRDKSILLIEATSNQVDQFGGYTGMTPADFIFYVRKIADKMRFPASRIVFGGDHLGPNVWQNEAPQIAMGHARDQIAAYVKAGFIKIHLDASMHLKGDKKERHRPLNCAVVAQRTAELCAASEKAAKALGNKSGAPVYVIGTDVPIPGGATETLRDVHVTTVEEVKETLQLTREAFYQKGLQDAWQRVIAVVVQPGVEFSHSNVFEYDSARASALTALVSGFRPILYEAHSTDYQTGVALRQMVNDHFAILKVGPGLTFVMREAFFALAAVEKEWLGAKKHVQLSNLVDLIDQVMSRNNKYWYKHYTGEPDEIRIARFYSYSDRIRYYWPMEDIQRSVNKLFHNLTKNPPPLNLLSQFLPDQYYAVRNKLIENTPVAHLYNNICRVLGEYAKAARMTTVD